MSGRIRLGCHRCDREDFDGVDALPSDWGDIHEIQSYDEATREISFGELTSSPLDWQTHLGTCPECQSEDN